MRSLELRVPPLAIVALTAAAMWALSRLVPSWHWPGGLRMAMSIALALTGLVVVGAGLWEFRSARTTVNPLEPDKATRVVSSGIYRRTRNPMYLGMLLLLAAFAAWLGSVVALLPLPAFVAYMNRFQIVPEERALAANFGQRYEEYRRSVRRWL